MRPREPSTFSFYVARIVLAVIAGTPGCVNVKKGRPNPTAVEASETRHHRIVAQEQQTTWENKSNGAEKPKNHGDLFKLPAHEVRESAFSDFGMSVKTNLEVKWGGDVEWMLVIGVDPGSSAAQRNLRVGDRILAMDRKPIPELSRDAMLAALFQRKKGERAEFLILGKGQPLPRFVSLMANRPDR